MFGQKPQKIMETSDNLDKVFDNVVYENNAQEVFKKLADLDNKRNILVSRWVWELIQNARGTAGSQPTLQVEVVLNQTHLLFRHNGANFKYREIAHLIYHGSSKHDPGDIGKFGSGFITTHLLSRQVRVRGTLLDGRSFDFILNRDGKDAPELRAAMETSKADFIASLDGKPEAVPAPFTTEYAYPLHESIREVVLKGIESLRLSAPYIFAFNFMLQRLKISTPGESVDLTRKELEPPFPASRYQGLCSNEQEPKQWLVTLAENSVEVSIALNSTGHALKSFCILIIRMPAQILSHGSNWRPMVISALLHSLKPNLKCLISYQTNCFFPKNPNRIQKLPIAALKFHFFPVMTTSY